ncbi:MAG: hypothetical protein ABSB19_15625 [Methylomonas sp.]
MKRISKTKRLFINAGMLCLFGFSGLSPAEPAHSGACPADAGHNMMHGSDSGAHAGHKGDADSDIRKQADEQCSGCHGADGVGVSGKIPNLAGQDSMYLCGWLAGCREQGDKCEGHEDLAGQWTNGEIFDFAGFYAHLPSSIW